MLPPLPLHPPIAGNRVCNLMLLDSLISAGYTLNFTCVRLEGGDLVAMMAHVFRRFNERTRLLPTRF